MRTVTPRRPLLCLLAAVLAFSTLTQQGGREPASADHTTAPTSVTLVGSIQSELGCAADWPRTAPPPSSPPVTPGCGRRRSWCRPAATSSRWRSTTPGTSRTAPRAAATCRSSWRSRPGSCSPTTRPPIAVGVQPADLAGTAVTAEDRALAGDSLRDAADPRAVLLRDGRPVRQRRPGQRPAGIAGDRLATGYDPTDKGFYHGGDIAGPDRAARLHRGPRHDRDLADAVASRTGPSRASGTRRSAGYHGYWVTDFTQIDPHFGTNAELKTFIDRAHARGIKVFFDIITNHTADVIDYAEGHVRLRRQGDLALPRRRGRPFDDRDYPTATRFPAIDPATSFPLHAGLPDRRPTRRVKVPAWLNDPTILPQPRRLDLRRRELDVRRLLRPRRPVHRAARRRRGHDRHLQDLGRLRRSTASGSTPSSTSTWSSGSSSRRRSATTPADIGNDDFFMFGEVFDANPSYMSTLHHRGPARRHPRLRLPGPPASASPRACRPPGCATSTPPTTLHRRRLQRLLAADVPRQPRHGPRRRVPRRQRSTGDELLRRDGLAHELMYLTRGQPVVYYGDEQGFTGDGGDKDARQDMFASQVASYNDDDLIGTDGHDRRRRATGAGTRSTAPSPPWPSCARPTRRWPTAPRCTATPATAPGVFAFSRIERRRAASSTSSPSTTRRPRRRCRSRPSWRTARSGRCGRAPARALHADDEARVSVTVPPLSAVVYRAAARLPARADAPAVLFDNLSAGGVVGPVGERAEVGRVGARRRVQPGLLRVAAGR